MKHKRSVKRSVISLALATIMLVSLCAVVSANVSAAPSNSRASVTTTPDLVGSPIAACTGPAACILNGSTDMYVFVKGNDGALWYRIWSTSSYQWTGSWVSLGGKLSSSPAAVSRSAGKIDAYVAGTDGAVYEKAYDGGWLAWYKVGGKVAPGTGPAASGWAGREDVFVQGTDGALYQTTWTSASPTFSNWVNLGGKLSASPTAISRHGYIIDVFVAGTDGAVYGKESVRDSWGSGRFFSLGGKVAPGTGPGACYRSTESNERMDVFIEGTNGALYQTTWTNASYTFSSWIKVGGVLSASPTASWAAYGSGQYSVVFVRGSNGLLYWNLGDNADWLGWYGPYQGPP